MNEVDSFVAMVNGTLQNQEDVDKVKNVMSQIDGYSAVTASGEMERVSLHPQHGGEGRGRRGGGRGTRQTTNGGGTSQLVVILANI